MYCRMAASSSRVLRWTPRRSCFSVKAAEPAFHEIDPRAPGRREVDVEARMPGEPPMDQRRFVRAGVIDDQVQVERRRDGRLDRVQELAKLSRAVALVNLTDDRAALGVQGGEECRRAVPGVVVAPALRLPGPHRQHRLGAVEGLDLGLLIDAEDQRFVRRVELQPPRYGTAAASARRQQPTMASAARATSDHWTGAPGGRRPSSARPERHGWVGQEG